MNEHEPTPRPAAEHATPDWRRLEVASGRYAELITAGITNALAERQEIDQDTARMIAHVLGRACGRDSGLAEFGRSGEGNYLDMRDEYLSLYDAEQANEFTNEMIDWLGTYLVERENLGSSRQSMNEYQAPKLNRLLVATDVMFEGELLTIHVPATLRARHIDALIEQLADLDIPGNDVLQAFLSLPDIDASSPDLMMTFHDTHVATFSTIEDATHELLELDESEKEVDEFARERGLFIDSINVDYELLEDRVREIYYLVELKGQVHVFAK